MVLKTQKFTENDTIHEGSVVISGMAGLYPQSHNVKEFKDILYNKVNPIKPKETRWKYNHPEVANSTGKVPELEYFDAQFFKIHYRLGNSMDSMSKKILEQAFDAIYDAGISPNQLSGTKVGVYLGTCFSETEKACFYVATSRTGFGIAGCSKSMFANRISYWLNAKGPSMSVDQACCSSTVALELAYQALIRGEVDSAIVGGTNICLHPQSTVHYGRIMPISKDGVTKSFDKNAHGCAKSEAINVLFLQRAKDALRVYAEVVHVKSEFCGLPEDEDGPLFTFYRDPCIMADFLKTFYEEANVPPQAVEYVEAFGSATPEVDKAELEAIDRVFCDKREDSLLVGSVMSNLGYVEAASGISSITKVLLGYEAGKLAGNINCDDPIDDVDGIRTGKMQIVRDHEPFRQGYTAVNGVSVTGVNAHVLLRGLNKTKDLNRYKSNIPHLVTISGRQKSAVEKIFEDLKKRPIDPEELALFHNIHQTTISGHLGRGYILLDTNKDNETVVLSETADYFDDVKRPLWFVYSGMGSQWAGMGAQLMRIPVFAAAIERCRQALEPKGIDILHIITAPDKKIYDNILHSFVGIAAVQIGLTDVLKEMGIVPDKIIGHSVGELGCAYADGCLTAEEMILSAYSRGLVSVQTPFIRGSMAAVGIGYEQIIKLCPPEIEVACHNSSESSTISGPADAMKQFVESLTSKGVFAKEVPCSNIAYHSRYIAEAGPGLLKYLSEVIPTPRARTERWVSTSIPQDRWEEPLAKYSSAEYHTNNLLCPVLFEETAQLIPKNAVLLEVAPHGLLQAILKRSLSTCVNIPLTRRGHPDNVTHMLDAIGKLYMQGYYPKVQALYPKVEFPVSTGTPMLGHLIEWAHTEKWNLPLYVSAHRKAATACKFVLSVHDEEHNYLQGHVIRGQNLLPFSAALVAVWDTLAMFFGLKKKHTSIQFKSIQFYAQPVLHDGRQLTLNVAIQRGSGKFEVSSNSMLMASGYAEIIEKGVESHRLLKTPVDQSEENTLKSNDIYNLLHSRDYQYSGDFRSLLSVNTSMTQADISWKDNWVAFIDALIQLNNVRRPHNTVSLPDSIRKLTIEIDEHKMSENKILRADVIDIHDCTRCGGVVIESLTFRDLPICNNEAVIMKSLQFVPNFMPGQSNELTALYVYLQIIAENVDSDRIDAVEIIENYDGISKYNTLDRMILDFPEINMKYEKIHQDVLYKKGLGKLNVVFVTNLSYNDKLTKAFDKYLPSNTLIVNKEYRAESRTRPSTLYTVLCNHNIEENIVLQLIRWKPDNTIVGTSALTVRSDSNLTHLISTLKFLPAHQKLLIFSSYPPIPNLENFVKEWRKEGRKVNLIMVNHSIDEQQFVEDLPKTDLAINVLDHGTWGGKYYVPMKTSVDHRRNAMLQSASIGDISSLHWVAATNVQEPGVNVKVHYAGVNELDVKRASGVVKFAKNNTKTYFGMDFSGTTASGSKVMGLIPGGSISSRVSANPNLLWPVPEHWTLEDAATVPLAYCQAFYCLAMKNRFFPGKTVLIHGGTGSLGQAAISICLAYKCEIFSTVSNRRKKEFLLKLFPTLKEENIGYSRDSTFGDMILTKTKEKGCDIVLSCVKGELKNISISSCGSSGIIIDTSLIHNHEDYNFGMHSLTKDRSYKLVDFSSMFEFGTIEEFKRLQALVSEGIALGYVRPLTRIVYSPKDVSRAFRLIDDSKHRGRVLIDLQQNIPIERASLQVSQEMAHLVISDDDILATQLIDRLVERGVRKVRLVTSPSDIVLYKKTYWSKIGVNIDVINQNEWNKNNITALLKDLNIEGVYIIITKDTIFDKVDEFLKELDLKTRELNPIRYFAIINENSGIGEHVSLLRKKNRLATALIRLPCLKMRDVENNCKMSMRSAIDIIEKSLLSQEAVVMAHRVPTKVNLLEDIAKWADINLPENADSDFTLLDLGMHESKTKAVQFCLRDHYNMWFLEEEIPNLTIERIQETEEKLLELQYTDEPGLSSFFSYVDSDELLATTEMTFLPTLTSSSSMRDDEFDPDQAFLCIVPGVEGHHQRFTELCERLKLPALVLQPGLGRDESLQDIAKRFAKCLLSRTELKKHFYLMGYETGVIIALEMAAILEDNGLTGVVYCLGGTPNEIVAQFKSKLTEINDEVLLQESVGKHMVKLMSGENTNSLDEKLNKATTWEERVTYCVRDLIGRVSYSTQYTKELIEAAYSRIMQVKKYAAKPQKLRSLLILMRANFNEEIKNDSMQQYSQQPIIEYQLKAPLCYAAQDLRCAAIINRHLEEDLIEAFDKRNLCETYLLNADTFMTAAVENVDS